jgi:hypothetical protein
MVSISQKNSFDMWSSPGPRMADRNSLMPDR